MEKRNILIVSERADFFGGIEQFIYKSNEILRKRFRLFGYFENNNVFSKDYTISFEKIFFFNSNDFAKDLEEIKSKYNIKICIIHKFAKTKGLQVLNTWFKTIYFVHDHNYYCMRKHKYSLLFSKNCYEKLSLLKCSFCSLLLEKEGRKIKVFNPFEKINQLKTVKEGDYFVVLSEYMKNNLISNGFSKNKVSIINPFINVSLNETTKVSKNKPEKINLLYVGQLVKGKGIDLLLKALPFIEVAFHLVIVGKGKELKKLEAIVYEFKLKEQVTFKGFQANIEVEYQKSDVIIMPSRWQEPFGLVGIEAFSYGKPVIAFDVGGISEWLKNNENGYLVKAFDFKEIANKINFLFSNLDIYKRLKAQAFTSVKKRYNINFFLENIEKILNKVICIKY